MLDNENNLILKVLSDYCNNRDTEFDLESIDIPKLYQICYEQNLDSLVYLQIRKVLDSINRKYKFFQSLMSDVFCDVNRKDMLREFTSYMEEKKIPFICMKGSIFRDYYPIPAVRSMGDVDIIIKPEDKETVDDIFVNQMGFTRFVDNHSVWTYYLKDFQFEVHNHMFYEELTSDFDYIDYFDHIFEHIHHDKVFDIESEYLYVPDENYHFLYLMTHTAKHIINNGSGFRAYLDMVMFTRNNEKLDWEWISEELKKMNLLQFAETCFALCERWFDVKMPLPHKELDESFFEEITEKTFNDGVFGLDNKDNEGAHTAKEIKRENRGYWLTSVRLMTHLLFPPYEDMILAPWYSFLKGKRWLLPFAWIYRWIYCIIHKFRFALSRLTEPFRIKEKIEKREDYINTWGL